MVMSRFSIWGFYTHSLTRCIKLKMWVSKQSIVYFSVYLCKQSLRPYAVTLIMEQLRPARTIQQSLKMKGLSSRPQNRGVWSMWKNNDNNYFLKTIFISSPVSFKAKCPPPAASDVCVVCIHAGDSHSSTFVVQQQRDWNIILFLI